MSRLEEAPPMSEEEVSMRAWGEKNFILRLRDIEADDFFFDKNKKYKLIASINKKVLETLFAKREEEKEHSLTVQTSQEEIEIIVQLLVFYHSTLTFNRFG